MEKCNSEQKCGIVPPNNNNINCMYYVHEVVAGGFPQVGKAWAHFNAFVLSNCNWFPFLFVKKLQVFHLSTIRVGIYTAVYHLPILIVQCRCPKQTPSQRSHRCVRTPVEVRPPFYLFHSCLSQWTQRTVLCR